MKKLYISLFILSFVILGCSKDNITTDIDEPTAISTNLVLDYERLNQSTSPGNYEFEDGMLVFPDEENFLQTEAYINNTSRSNLDIWRDNLEFETPGAAFSKFLDDTCCDRVTSEGDLQAIEALYADRIKIEVDQHTGEKVYAPKTEIFEEFVNLNGIFKVGKDYYKVVENKLFSIINGDLQLVNSIDRNTVGIRTLDLGSPIVKDAIDNGFVYIIESEIETRGDDDCCSSKDTKTTFYDQDTHKIKVSYRIRYFIRVTTLPDGLKVYFPNAQVKSSVNNERRKNFILNFWGCDKTNLSINATIGFQSIVGTNTTNHTYSFSDTNSNACWLWSSQNFQLGVFTLIPDIKFCVESVNITGTNLSEPVSVSLNCDIVEDVEPRVIFYEGNNGTQDLLCTIALSNPVGHVNFKEDSYGCDNDEARSARFIDMRQGMLFRIYDDPDGATDDDFVIISIKRDFSNKLLGTFEASESDLDWTVTYFEDNGLDGKVSAFRDN
ncbi:MAG: hypothetical protein ACI9Y7_003211 [Dokdonia sp.]|jgi:hypothetical protein